MIEPNYTQGLSSRFYGLTIVWERETGILKKLLVAPASKYATVIGRSVASGVRAIFQVLIIIPVALLIGVDFVRGLMISGDISNLLPDIAAIVIFDVIMFAVASISFSKIIE